MADDIMLTETTLRQIMKDYVYRRPKHTKKMIWNSQFAPIIIVDLEEKPRTQESVGYELQDEDNQ